MPVGLLREITLFENVDRWTEWPSDSRWSPNSLAGIVLSPVVSVR